MVRRLFPHLTERLSAVSDPRQPDLCTYSNASILRTGILLFLCRLEARRQVRFRLQTPLLLQRLGILSGQPLTSVPHGDTLYDYLFRLGPEDLRKILPDLLRCLLEARRLEDFRLLGKFYPIGVDMTGHLCLGDRPSPFTEGCLTQTTQDGKTIYYRPVCEAKLLTRTGLALSIGSEFVENFPRNHQSDESYKQDCERKAIPYEGHLLNVLHCHCTQSDGSAINFLWVTNIPITKTHCYPLAQEGGRQRWRIENEGFRTQKHAGFEMEHAYAKTPHVAKHFYFLLQIAHLLAQLFECYCHGKLFVKKTFGSLRNLAHFLLESFRRDPMSEPSAFRAFLEEPIQIRLNTS